MKVELKYIMAKLFAELVSKDISERDLMAGIQEHLHAVTKEGHTIDTDIGNPGERIPDVVSMLHYWLFCDLIRDENNNNMPYFSVRNKKAFTMSVEGYEENQPELKELKL